MCTNWLSTVSLKCVWVKQNNVDRRINRNHLAGNLQLTLYLYQMNRSRAQCQGDDWSNQNRDKKAKTIENQIECLVCACVSSKQTLYTWIRFVQWPLYWKLSRFESGIFNDFILFCSKTKNIFALAYAELNYDMATTALYTQCHTHIYPETGFQIIHIHTHAHRQRQRRL